METNQTEVSQALHQLNALAQTTRDQLRELLHMVSSQGLTMSYSQLFHADEALGKLARLDRKQAKEMSHDR